MITGWEVYWITRLDGVGGFFVIIALLVGMFLLFGWAPPAATEQWDEPLGVMVRKMYKIFTPVFLIVALLAVLTPSTKEAVAIYIVPKIVNNEQLQKLPDNALKFMNKKFEEWVEDLSKKKKK